MRVVTRRRLALVVLLASLAGLGRLAWPYAEGASFVVRAAEMQGAARVAADFITEAATERDFVMPVGRSRCRTMTRSSAPAIGNGRSNTASTTAKSAVFAPMPSASVNTAAAVNPGSMRNNRNARRTSCINIAA